ncbi:hypothetical protein NP233_g215 [Leucocoprinus birnbaumii]|uniref:Uncharacterized protein n=1 Tax=Leucocoprinus birnbaumii TaxID=56174 RepID=A0AAD5W398_9AGAR|nr:hypothetical protein NP233_g215 [Leucocoprinus birnbaumii]
MPISHSPFVMQSIRVTSLAFLLHEICLTLGPEIDLIWTQVILPFTMKALVVNRIFDMLDLMYRDILPSPFHDWYTFQIIIAGSLILSLELMLMTRVYALYQRSVRIACILICILLCEILLAVFGLLRDQTMSASKIQQGYHGRTPRAYICFGAAVLISQSIVLILTIYQYLISLKSCPFNPVNPVLSLVLRQGSIGFIAMTSVIVWTLLSAITDRFVPIIDSCVDSIFEQHVDTDIRDVGGFWPLYLAQ